MSTPPDALMPDAATPDGAVVPGATPLATPVAGVFLSPAPYERVVAGLRAAVEAMAGPPAWPALTVPPVISRDVVERAGYVRSFPQLVGTVHSYRGGRREWLPLSRRIGGGDWYEAQEISDVVLLPAPCYHVYPLLSGADVVRPRQFCVHATCFRQEATAEPGRLRSFRVSDIVIAGLPDECRAWRDRWVERMTEWLRGLGLAVSVEVADDPFFGPGDHLLRDTQREQELKWELRVPLVDGVVQAVGSANRHLAHFGTEFGFNAGDEPAHSACVGFGLDRITLALINRHGPEPDRWPAAARQVVAP